MTRRSCDILWAVFALLSSGSLAAVIQQASGRFDPLVIQDPSSRLGIVAEDPTRTPGSTPWAPAGTRSARAMERTGGSGWIAGRVPRRWWKDRGSAGSPQA